jgi:hypothetical protein
MTYTPTKADENKLFADVSNEFPEFDIVDKSESTFMKVLNVLLLVLTFGQSKKFMTHYVTTIGNTMYVPEAWDIFQPEQRMEIYRHERVHLRQSKAHGAFTFAVRYLFLPFPFFWATWRTRFEQEAYEESMRAMLEYQGVGALDNPTYRAAMVAQFTTGAYGWMCINRIAIEQWFDTTAAKLRSEAAYSEVT